MTEIPPPHRERSARGRRFFDRRRIGRAVTIAAVVAAVACLVGAVVAWQLLGELRDRTATSLQLLESTLNNVDDTLAIAQDVTGTVGNSLETIEESLAILTQGVQDGATALDAVADLTEDVPPALDRLDRTLVRLRDAAAIVDTGLNAHRPTADRPEHRRHPTRCVRRRSAGRHQPDRRGPTQLDELDPLAR